MRRATRVWYRSWMGAMPCLWGAAAVLCGCASMNVPPEPDMKHLVAVNQTLPPELMGHGATLSTTAGTQ